MEIDTYLKDMKDSENFKDYNEFYSLFIYFYIVLYSMIKYISIYTY